MSLSKTFTAPRSLSALLLISALSLAGCSGDSDDATTAQGPAVTQHNTMDVKQPEPETAVKEPLQEAPAPAPAAVEEAVKEAEAVVEEKVEEVKAAVEEVATAAPSGEAAYSTCVGCHGASGEGGVGPRLNNQTVDDIVSKLERYKAGEQIGPMTAMMAPMAQPLSAEDMKAIAEYITSK